MTTLEFSNLKTTQQMCLVSANFSGNMPLYIERIQTTLESNNIACMVGMPLELTTCLPKLKKWIIDFEKGEKLDTLK